MAVTNNFDVETVTVQYNSAVELLLQQTNTRLRGATKTGFHVGKGASPVQYVGVVEFKQAGPRGSTITPQDVGYQRRWVFPADKDLPVHVERFDELKTIVDPKAPLTAAVQAAGNRLFDDVIINGVNGSGGFFGTATLGADPAAWTTETFNSGSDFPTSVSIADTFGSGSASSMTVAKWIEAKRILRHYENDLEAMSAHIAISSEEESSLMKQLEFTSREFRDTATYDAGRPKSFMGTMIHYSERLNISGSDRQIPFWLEDGMYLGLWMDMETIISQRNDITGHPWQAYTMVSLGSTRLQGGKVIQVNCTESAGGDITV